MNKNTITVPPSTQLPRLLTPTEHLIGGYLTLCEVLNQMGYAGIPTGDEARELIEMVTTPGEDYDAVPDAALAARLQYGVTTLLGKAGVRKQVAR